MSPYWCAYRSIIEARGFRLDTYRDVKQWYHDYWAAQASEGRTVSQDLPGYLRACRGKDENDLCRDAGLVSTCASYLLSRRANLGLSPYDSQIVSFVGRSVLPGSKWLSRLST